MKIQELVILGLLDQNPEHGYQIKKFLKQVLALYADIETESIYYPLKILEEQGMVRKTVGRQGQRPEKHVYSITPAGKAYFQELLIKNLLFLRRPFINIDLSLYFLPSIDPQTLQHKLKIRRRGLERIKQWLLKERSRMEKQSSHVQLIIEHNLELLEAEQRFTQKLLQTLKSKRQGYSSHWSPHG